MDHGWTTGTGPVMCKNAAAMTMVKRSVRDYTFDTFFSRTERRFLFSCFFTRYTFDGREKTKKILKTKLILEERKYFLFFHFGGNLVTLISILYYIVFLLPCNTHPNFPGTSGLNKGGLNINILHQGWTRRVKYKHFTSGLNKGG